MSSNPENKKPIYKKWWFWAIIIVVVIAIGGSQTQNTNTSTSVNSLDANIQNTTITENNTSETMEEEITEPDVPKEYKNALEKAKTYSEVMHMSKQGIYDQLTSEYGEKFPADAAQYAIDNLNADFKQNALEKAKTYQETMNMSKNAIYDQLISEYGEKFTTDEAQYAIDNLE